MVVESSYGGGQQFGDGAIKGKIRDLPLALAAYPVLKRVVNKAKFFFNFLDCFLDDRAWVSSSLSIQTP